MDEQKLAQLRNHYDTTDVSADIERAQWETDVDSDPMITTSLRLPKSVLDWVRQRAEAEHVKPTALIRRWIEQQRDGAATDLGSRLEHLVNRLEDAVMTEKGAPRTAKRAAWKGRTAANAARGRWRAQSAVPGQAVAGRMKAHEITGPAATSTGSAANSRGRRGAGRELPPSSC